MPKRTALPVTEFVEIMERAGRNGTRAHLRPAVVRHILAHPAWREFMADRQREMISQWEEVESLSPKPTGMASSTAPELASGLSPSTTIAVTDEAVERAVRRRALQVSARLPRDRRSKPSEN